MPFLKPAIILYAKEYGQNNAIALELSTEKQLREYWLTLLGSYMLPTVLLILFFVWTPFAIANGAGVVVSIVRLWHSRTTNWGFVYMFFLVAVLSGPIGSYMWYQDWLANRQDE